VKLADKIRYLREVEGNLRGLGRAMTQQELVRAIQAESGAGSKRPGAGKAGASISQSYLSQIESGARPHLTNTTRLLLAKFFKVHPGYLVDDPEGYQAELLSDVRNTEDKLDLWLVGGAERFRRDPALCQSLLSVANHHDSRRCLLLMEAIIETPALLDRLFDVLRPARDGGDAAAEKQFPPLRGYATPAGTTTREGQRPWVGVATRERRSVAGAASTMRTQKGAAGSRRK
jgi:transcriptional regulator with XRE-family HTH domain